MHGEGERPSSRTLTSPWLLVVYGVRVLLGMEIMSRSLLMCCGSWISPQYGQWLHAYQAFICGLCTQSVPRGLRASGCVGHGSSITLGMVLLSWYVAVCTVRWSVRTA